MWPVNSEFRYPPPVEVTVYYVVAEALTNPTKHAKASLAEVMSTNETAHCGCASAMTASARRGSGLIGLHDRVEAIDGTFDLTSPVGQGTLIQVSLPLERAGGPLPATVQPGNRWANGR